MIPRRALPGEFEERGRFVGHRHCPCGSTREEARRRRSTWMCDAARDPWNSRRAPPSSTAMDAIDADDLRLRIQQAAAQLGGRGRQGEVLRRRVKSFFPFLSYGVRLTRGIDGHSQLRGCRLAAWPLHFTSGPSGRRRRPPRTTVPVAVGRRATGGGATVVGTAGPLRRNYARRRGIAGVVRRRSDDRPYRLARRRRNYRADGLRSHYRPDRRPCRRDGSHRHNHRGSVGWRVRECKPGTCNSSPPEEIHPAGA